MSDSEVTLRESRLSRWSRLKREGESDEPSEQATVAPTEDDYDGEAPQIVAPDPHALPGGAAARRGALVPRMPSLVDQAEQGDELEEAANTSGQDDLAVAEKAERELTPEEQEAIKDLPPLDSLTKDSDFTPFMAEKVPEFIRRKAMSILWRSDPVLANLDGLNDYDENYRIIDKLISAAEDTIYRVGKGHVRPEDEENPEDQEADQIEKDADQVQSADADPSNTAPSDTSDEDTLSAPEMEDSGQTDDEDIDEDELEARLSSSSVRKPEQIH